MWLALLLGCATGAALDLLFVASSTRDGLIAVAYWAFGLLVALPLGATLALASFGAGLGVEMLGRRSGLRASTVACLGGALAAIVGLVLSALVRIGPLSELGEFAWLSNFVAIFGGAAMFGWLACRSRQVAGRE
ncbi:hypothetical protein [Agromyces sp. NPDC055658]